MTEPPLNTKMRQALYAWNYREWGGAQVYFMSLMKAAKNEFRVTALLPSDSEPKMLQYLNTLEVPYEFLDPAPVLNTSIGLLTKLTILRSEMRLTKKILARNNLSETIVHIDLGFWQSALALFRLCMKTNVFVTVHTALPFQTGWRAWRWRIKGKFLSRFSSFHLLASNNDAKESLRPYIGAGKFKQVEVTYSGIDPDEITKVTEDLPAGSEIRQKYRLPNNKPVLMTVGQFIERKGCWVLLETLRQLKFAEGDFVFAWLSTSLPGAETLHRIDGFGLGDSFRVMGAEEIGETREDLLTLLSAADIFVLASLVEGLPIALIEAMALGLPCVASNVNAIPEAIENEVNGLLVPTHDSVRLRTAISSLMYDPQKRSILGAAAKRTAFEKFNARITAKRTLELYTDVWKSSY